MADGNSEPTVADVACRSAGGIAAVAQAEREAEQKARARSKQLFGFLKAYANMRRSQNSVSGEEPWSATLDDLPEHPTIRRLPIEGAESSDSPFLVVTRAKKTRSPAPGRALVEWVNGGWDDPARIPMHREVIERERDSGAREVERFDADPDRVAAFGAWSAEWRAWAEVELPARKSLAFYERLFALHGQFERDGERLELLAANGRLRFKSLEGAVDYPVLLQRVALEFDPDVPEFRLRNVERDAELQVRLLQRIPDVPPQLLGSLREELEVNDYHPLGEKDAPAWLRSIITRLTPDGELLASGAELPPLSATPILAAAPSLLLRRRLSGVPEAMDRVLIALEEGLPVPPALWGVLGVARSNTDAAAERAAWEAAADKVDPLLSKVANQEQIDLIRQLDTRGAVLVQGPPGTGKSHTIANLIGHLVANGQRVLVTSHTTKALRVLRGHVVKQLRPLCVSVLDNDLEGRRQLEEAISHIQSGLQQPSDLALAQIEDECTIRRKGVSETLRKSRDDLYTIRRSEYTPIVLGGEQFDPIKAAKVLRQFESERSWLPGPVHESAPLPVTLSEVRDLYGTNATLSPDEERLLQQMLPDLDRLLTGEGFEQDVGLADLEVPSAARDYFTSAVLPGDGQDEQDLAIRIRAKLLELEALKPWERVIVASSLNGAGVANEWLQIADLIDRAVAEWERVRERIIEDEPILPTDIRIEDVLVLLGRILEAVSPGERLGLISKVLNPSWKLLLASARVSGHEPVLHSDFLALQAAAKLAQSRDRLRKRWNVQVVPIGMPTFETLRSVPEDDCKPFAKDLRERLVWWSSVVEPLINEARQQAIDWDRLLKVLPREPGSDAELKRLVLALLEVVRALEARASGRRIMAARVRLQEQHTFLTLHSSDPSTELLVALERRDLVGWLRTREKLAKLNGKRLVFSRRQELLAKLEPFAVAWSNALRLRQGVHGASEPPGDAVLGWQWRQLAQELDRRAARSENVISRAINRGEADHRSLTADLIKARTWRALRSRTGIEHQQALVGWADLVKKAGKGTGKRAPALLAQARQQLEKARAAVPVWIMPLSTVFESIDPRTTSFDVVVIDEASQADPTALFALMLGKRVVVVGDHEQVSPDAVGERVDQVDALVAQYLDQIPLSQLYNGTTSIYDFARQAFPGQLRLVEHFRCVPEIIDFSNRLSYNGEIKALRESAGVLAPHLIEQCVQGSRGSEKLNDAEVQEIGMLIAACIEQPEYAGKSFGVVSLLGEEQAVRIDELLRRMLPPQEIQGRQIVCGNAAQFQGDERDVIFLSMVDSPQDGPLVLKARDQFKQRYNVAASRARDQLWVVHSLDPLRDLKPNDLRLQLIQHVRNPDLVAKAEAEARAVAESPFEAEVAASLINVGYRIRSQVKVGAYRIDMVAEGVDVRVAIECDGEKFHGPDMLERDLGRQMVLERLGWQFIRIRGSKYYRDPNRTMAEVCELLAERGVQPIGPEGADQEGPDRRGAALLARVRARAAELKVEWIEKQKA